MAYLQSKQSFMGYEALTTFVAPRYVAGDCVIESLPMSFSTERGVVTKVVGSYLIRRFYRPSSVTRCVSQMGLRLKYIAEPKMSK